MSKNCTKCHQLKDDTAFTKRRLSKDGLDLWCRECKSTHEANKHHSPFYEGDKLCSSCGVRKLRIDFNKDHRRIDGLESRCKECSTKRSRHNMLRRKYNIDEKQYSKLVEEHDGKCSICGSTVSRVKFNDRLSVDHDHKTGKIRGLLCSNCNLGIGLFHDDVTLLQKVINYLTQE